MPTTGLENIRFLLGRFAVSVLAADAANALEAWEAGQGHVLPTLTASSFSDETSFEREVRAALRTLPAISIALGGGADGRYWQRVMNGGRHGATHLNQPFTTAGFVKGTCPEAWVNAVVAPGRTRSRTRLTTIAGLGPEINVRDAARFIKEAQLDAMKYHPANPGENSASVLAAARAAAAENLSGFEPAGGLDLESTPRMLAQLAEVHDIKVIPHVFSAVQDPTTGRTDPSRVEQLVSAIEKALT